jgi:hypothetical protein
MHLVFLFAHAFLPLAVDMDSDAHDENEMPEIESSESDDEDKSSESGDDDDHLSGIGASAAADKGNNGAKAASTIVHTIGSLHATSSSVFAICAPSAHSFALKIRARSRTVGTPIEFVVQSNSTIRQAATIVRERCIKIAAFSALAASSKVEQFVFQLNKKVRYANFILLLLLFSSTCQFFCIPCLQFFVCVRFCHSMPSGPASSLPRLSMWNLKSTHLSVSL